MKEIGGTGSRVENETTIIFADSGPDAVINTASPTVFRRLRRLGYEPVWTNGCRARFTIPRDRVRLPKPPRTGRPMSERQRAALQDGSFSPQTPRFDAVAGKNGEKSAPDTSCPSGGQI